MQRPTFFKRFFGFLMGMLFFLCISQTSAQQISLPSVEQIQQYYSAGQYRQLINHLEPFLANDAHQLDATRLRYLGAAYAQAGEYGKAIRTWEQAIAEDYRLPSENSATFMKHRKTIPRR
jgi:tetratricopeptide (TPR) repeat protein